MYICVLRVSILPLSTIVYFIFRTVLALWYFLFLIFFTYIFQQSLRLDPDDRPTCTQLLKHEFFQKDGFSTRIQHDLKQKVHRETHNNPLIKTPSNEKDDGDAKGSNAKKKKKLNDTKDNKVTMKNTDKQVNRVSE